MFRDKGKWSHPGWIEPDGKGKGSKWVPGSSGKTPGYKHLSYQSNTWSAKPKATRPSVSFAGKRAWLARTAIAGRQSATALMGRSGGGVLDLDTYDFSARIFTIIFLLSGIQRWFFCPFAARIAKVIKSLNVEKQRKVNNATCAGNQSAQPKHLFWTLATMAIYPR